MPPPPTARLEFRRWRAEDADLASTLWCDPRVMQFLGGPYSADEVRERLAREVANDAQFGIQYWPVFTRETNEFAGCCGLKPHRPDDCEYEIGFHFLPKFWGGGYASEAARAVMAWAFEEFKVSALFAGHHPENEASRALLRKLGFEVLGTHFFARTGLDHPWLRRIQSAP
ncbi:MAG TPA: GNAT family N-acetyltransferase [Thermoanaerobaculia bacterium]|nr:GNAT family N-acetyltransferase [Thermoanaerobaculia bacterium]